MKYNKFQCPECSAFTAFYRGKGSIETCSKCGQKCEIIDEKGFARRAKEDEEEKVDKTHYTKFSSEPELKKVEEDPFSIVTEGSSRKTNIEEVSERIDLKAEEKKNLQILHSKKLSKRKLILSLSLGFIALLGVSAFFVSNKSNKIKAVFADKSKGKLEAKKSLLENPEIFSLAEKSIEDFFEASSANQAANHVLPDPKIIQTMSRYWSQKTLAAKPTFSHTSLVNGSDGVLVNYYVRLEGISAKKTCSVFIDEALNTYFDWRSFEGVGEVRLDDVDSLESGQVVELRGLLSTSNYYNFGFTEENSQAFNLRDYKSNQINLYLNKDKIDEDMREFITEVSARPKISYLYAEKQKQGHFEIVRLVIKAPWDFYFQEYQLPLLKN